MPPLWGFNDSVFMVYYNNISPSGFINKEFHRSDIFIDKTIKNTQLNPEGVIYL